MSGKSLADWTDMPRTVRMRQQSHERMWRMVAARRAGATFTELARALGVSVERARQAVLKGERILQSGKGYVCPLEQWIQSQGSFYAVLGHVTAPVGRRTFVNKDGGVSFHRLLRDDVTGDE